MNRGEFISLAVERSNSGGDRSRLIGACMASVLMASGMGRKMSVITVTYPSSLMRPRIVEVQVAVSAASDFMQQEGFQTDEVLRGISEAASSRQLKVFWGNGKLAYEQTGQLGVFEDGKSDVSVTVLPAGLAIY